MGWTTLSRGCNHTDRENNSEKIIKQDTARRYDITVIGEEPHVAYNRVGLSSFFEHRKIEDLYLNPKEWVRADPPQTKYTELSI